MGVAERRERERLQRRNDIIDAAERVVFKEGFDRVTMAAIAEKAELGKATLYLYFKNKEDLLFAIFLRGQEILFKMVDDSLKKAKSTRNKIEILLKVIFRFQSKHPDYFNLFFYFMTNRIEFSKDTEDHRRNEEMDQAFLNKWILLVDEGKQEGIIRKDLNPLPTVLLIWMQLIGMIKIYSVIEPEVNQLFRIKRSVLMNEYTKLIFQGILDT